MYGKGGASSLGTGDDINIYAWSDTDYNQIKKEMELKGCEIVDEEKLIIDREWTDF